MYYNSPRPSMTFPNFRIDPSRKTWYDINGDFMIENLYFYIQDKTDPYENLAIEKRLLDTVAEGALILYLWQNSKTVVIGKNQNPWAECNCRLLEQEGGRLARRLSGGGAVFHDLGNLNFTFICREEDYDLAKQQEVLLNACSLAGIRAEVSGRNDLLAEGRKFSGNAFYHAGGKAYHHGTLLICADTAMVQRYLTPSQAKLQAKGVKSVRSRIVNLTEIAPKLTPELMKKHLCAAAEQVYQRKGLALPSIPHAEIAELAAQYADWDYLYGTPLPLSLVCEERFDWGSIQIQLEVKDGRIQKCKVYTDALDWTLSEQIESLLTGVRFSKDCLKIALGTHPYQEDLLGLLI